MLSYVWSGNTVEIIYLKEIVIASLGLLLVPKKIQINISDFFGKELYLPVGSTYGITSGNTDTIDKLNTVTDTINEMSRTYKEDLDSNKENSTQKMEDFIESLQEKLEIVKDNVLYDDFMDEDNGLISNIYNVLEEKNSVTKEDIVKLLEERNEFVLGFEDFDTNMKIEEDINKLARLINDTYKIGKLNSIWKQKMKENKKVISSQLDGVSKAISNVARSMYRGKEYEFQDEKQEIRILCTQRDIKLYDVSIEQNKNGRYVVSVYIIVQENDDDRISEIELVISKVLKEKLVIQKEETIDNEGRKIYKYVYASKDKFTMQIGIAHETKNGSAISGDSSVQTRLDDGKYLVAISDGMGSGSSAKESSSMAVKMLNRLLCSGFDKDTSLELINSSMYINSKSESYATLDVSILDLYAGNMEFMKNGACPTFIKNKRNVSVIKSISLPARYT